MAKLANLKCSPTGKEKKGVELQILGKDRMRLIREAGGMAEDTWQERPNDMDQFYSH